MRSKCCSGGMSARGDALADAALDGGRDVEAFGQWGVASTSVPSPVKPPGTPRKSKIPPGRSHQLRSPDQTTGEAYDHSLEDALQASSRIRPSLSSRGSSVVSNHKEIRSRASVIRRPSLRVGKSVSLPDEFERPAPDRRPDNASIPDQQEKRKKAGGIRSISQLAELKKTSRSARRSHSAYHRSDRFSLPPVLATLPESSTTEGTYQHSPGSSRPEMRSEAFFESLQKALHSDRAQPVDESTVFLV